MDKSKSKTGIILISITLLLTLSLWILSKNSISEITSWPILSLNQIAALLGTVLFVWSMILATRLDFLENWFGSLDKVYVVHRRVSEIGAVLILLHPVALALDNMQKGLKYFLPIHANNAINLGIYSFWVFVVAILLTLFIRKINLPYHIWKQTHKFLNLAMILALLHVIMIKSDTSAFLPLGIWMYAFVGLGVASGLYMSFLYKYLGPRYDYEIVLIERYDDIHDVYMKPLKKKLPHDLAQFAYVSFQSKGLSSESHPYCITSLPGEDLIRFSIKEIGDYTKQLGKVRVGDKVSVWGAYGRLGQRFQHGGEDAVFVAGGIGIAPFLSMFKKAGLEEKKRHTVLFYCTKFKKEAVFGSELKKLLNASTNLYYHNQCSREPNGCRLTAAQVIKETKDIKNTIVYLCGPSKMMKGMKRDFMKNGFKQKNIVLEDFEMI
jgi:predicted ferric reductase